MGDGERDRCDAVMEARACTTSSCSLLETAFSRASASSAASARPLWRSTSCESARMCELSSVTTVECFFCVVRACGEASQCQRHRG